MDPEQPGAAPSPPPPPPPSPPQAAASFAAVVADIPQAGFSALAAAASEQYAAVKASFQPPLEYDRLLAAGTASLVLLEGVMPTLVRLARFADDVSRLVGGAASAADAGDGAGLRAAT
jgi:hypothetical protein